MRKPSLRLIALAVLIIAVTSVAGCDNDDNNNVVIHIRRTATPTSAPTPAPTATAVPTPIPTPIATSTPAPTPPSTPTATATPRPTPTPKPTPTPTASPTPTPSATPTAAPNACLPSSSDSVLVSGTDATAYIPVGNGWEGEETGIDVVPIETSSGIGGSDLPPPTVITTPNIVNSCSSNSTTGETVCVANNTDVYLITGSTLNKTLTSGATGEDSFSGGSCFNCGVVIDSSINKALITIGLATGGPGGYQFLDLAGTTPTFESPIPAGGATSENVSIDPTLKLVLSPNEAGNYQLTNISTGTDPTTATLFNNLVGAGEFDSAAEDCTTGIALSTLEFTEDLFITDLKQAKFTGGTPGTPGTWTDTASATVAFPEFADMGAGTCGFAVAPGAHFGIVTGEFGGNLTGVIELPATSGTGTPSFPDYVAFSVPDEPNGNPYVQGGDPHTVTAYISPNTGKAYGIISDGGVGGPPSYVAIIDLKAMLDAPRTGHVVTTIPTGAVTFVKVTP